MKQRLGALALLLTSCAFSLWIAETVFWRYTAWMESKRPSFEPAGKKDDLYHHDLKANFTGVQYFGDDKVMYSAQYFTNNLGFRDSEVHEIQAAPTRPRVVFIGDSFTEGVGMDFARTFIGIIKTSRPELEILNAGVSSYAPVLENVKLETRVLPLHPAQVVMLVDPSDVQDSLIYHAWMAERGKPARPADWHDGLRAFWHGHARIIEALLDLVSPNLLANRDAPRNPAGGVWTTFYQDRVRWLTDREQFDAWGAQGLELMFQDLAETVRLSRTAAFQLTLVIYPWPDHIAHPNHVVDYRGRMREFCERNGIALVDLFGGFQASTRDTYFLKGDVHWNEQGHEYVASQVLSALLNPGAASQLPAR